jgi:hypothetical protein
MRLLGALAALVALAAGPVSPAAGAAAPLGDATALVAVGPGVAETSQRQVVRTRDAIVYIASVDDHGIDGPSTAELHLYRATTAGTPTAFEVADASNEPQVTWPLDLSGGDIRIDAAGTIHTTYAVTNLGTEAVGEYPGNSVTVKYRTFDTVAGAWGSPHTVTTLPFDLDGTRGRVVSALALAPSGRPLVVTASPADVAAWSPADNGSWAQEPVDGTPGLHPSLAFDAQGRARLAWLASPYDKGRSSIRYAERSAAGAWSSPQTVADDDVLANDTLDQGPSLAFDAQARPVVAWLDGSDDVVVATRDDDGHWIDEGVPDTYAHSPAIALRGDDTLVFLGHDRDIHPAYLSRGTGSSEWSSVGVFSPPLGESESYAYDGSASPRFDPLFDPDCRTLDVAFFDEYSEHPGRVGQPDLYYAAVALPEPPGGCPPAVGLGDASPPDPPPPAEDPPPPADNPPPDPAPAVVLGTRNVQPQLDGNDAGMAEVFQTTATTAGTIESLSIYLDPASTAEKLVAGLYADDAGHPGALLAQGDAIIDAYGWQDVAVPATAVTAGERYWIGVLGAGGGRIAFRDADGDCRSETTPSSLTLDVLPATWSSGAEYDDCPVSAYAAGS